jgi:hypothetical protein
MPVFIADFIKSPGILHSAYSAPGPTLAIYDAERWVKGFVSCAEAGQKETWRLVGDFFLASRGYCIDKYRKHARIWSLVVACLLDRRPAL